MAVMADLHDPGASRSDARCAALLRLAHRHRMGGDPARARALFAVAECEAWRAGRADLVAQVVLDEHRFRPAH